MVGGGGERSPSLRLFFRVRGGKWKKVLPRWSPLQDETPVVGGPRWCCTRREVAFRGTVGTSQTVPYIARFEVIRFIIGPSCAGGTGRQVGVETPFRLP